MALKNPEARRAYQREWRAKNRDKVTLHNRRAALKRKYGITPETYEALVATQGARCAVCNADEPGGGRAGQWHVDHCHDTGQIRGLLCLRCNAGIGLLRDDVEVLRAALAYLETHSRPQSED